jgi:iron complex outermembrane receptor protein
MLSFRQITTAAFFILSLIFCSQANAQETTVRFKVTGTKNEPVPFATVTVVSVPDTVHRQEKVADSTGSVSFQLLQSRPYLVRVSAVNAKPLEKSLTIKGDNPLYTLIAEPISKSLKGVVITANKPLMRQEDDKTIVDPENLASSSTNAYEIMEKIPGLYVDQDGNIYLNSMTPATVYINGREQKMSASDIATMLKNLPPNAIASIEILRTPSSKYDASGSGGIVNVVLKKGVKIGLTGSATIGLNQGRYGNRFVGLNINNNNGKLSTYLNLQYGRRKSYEEIKTDRVFRTDSLLSQDALTVYPSNSYYIGYGLNYQLTKKWELGYDGRFSYNNPKNYSTNYSQTSGITTHQMATANQAFVQNSSTNYNITQGLNAKYKIDSLGSEWTTDLSYTFSPNKTDQDLNTVFLQPAYPSSVGDGHLENKLSFFSGQTNLLQKLPYKITLETGLKTTLVHFSNTTDYYGMVNGIRVKSNSRSGSYKYDESINSAYLQASKSFSGFVVKAGTRLENTNMKGVQFSPKDTSFKLSRTDLFPYVYLSRTIMKVAGFDVRAYLVYRRTISRPAYEYLNPSQRIIDPYLIETGNPSLRPQFTKNYEANISADEHPILAFGLNDTKDIFTQVIYPYKGDSSGKISARTYDNLGSNKEMYFRVLGAIPPGKRYFFVVGGQYNHNFYNGLYENKAIQFKRGSWTIFTYQTFKLTPLTQLTLNGFARFNGQLQFYELSSFGSLNFSVAQQFLKKKLTVTLSANDIFFTNNNQFTLNQGSINASGLREGDTRRFGINLRYNFGIRKKEENRMMDMESPEKGS